MMTRLYPMPANPSDLEKKLLELERVNRALQDDLSARNEENAKLSALLNAAGDLADRKRTEDDLRAANRALRAISDCNQALMRLPSEPELLDAVCRIVVHTGGYRYAWVGYTEHDAEQSIRPVAQCGFPEGFIERMRVSWGDNERGRGSTATAIRTAQPFVMQNLQSDPRFAPWRQHAVELGQQAAISLPLIDNGIDSGKVFGALTIYAADPLAFNETETGLLVELAGDLAYGIVAAHTREALERSELRLLLALDAASLGMWDWNMSDGRIIWSPLLEALLGVAPAPHHSYDEFFLRVHPDDRDDAARAIELARDSHSVFDHEYRVVWDDGSIRWAHSRGQFIYDIHGQAVRMVGVVADITTNRKLTEQLQQSQKLEAIGTLASGIAHDFNNILSAIVGNIELAQQDLPAKHSASISLQEILKASRRGRDVVRQILAFSRPEIQQRARLALGPIVTEAAKLLRATVPAGIELHTVVAPDLPDVHADATQIHQVLVNLCTNAWHAIAQNGNTGKIDVVLTDVQIEEHAFSEPIAPGRYVCVSVSDTGVGMSKETVQRIFEPFFTTKSKTKGSGLGLAVVHGIVRSHGGAIAVHSTPNEGSRFDIYFPAVASHSEFESSANETDRVPAGMGQRILYIDDDEALVFLGTRVLERFGYRVEGFSEPARALEVFSQDPSAIDLVVTDLNMPGMSGLDVVRAVHAIRADIPIILASGYIDQELQRQATAAGVARIVYKPNSTEELGRAIHKLMAELTG